MSDQGDVWHDPFLEGVRAFDNGSSVSDNPYEKGTSAFSEWREGFLFADGEKWVYDWEDEGHGQSGKKG